MERTAVGTRVGRARDPAAVADDDSPAYLALTFPATGGENVTVKSSDDDFAWGAGGGVDIFLKRRLSLRPAFRWVTSEATGVMVLIVATVTAGYHW